MLVYYLLFLGASANFHIEMTPKRSLKDLVHSIISKESSGLQSQSSLYNHQEIYYTGKVWIGTPPQEFELLIDTGSSYTWVHQTNTSKQYHEFNPLESSTYINLTKPVSLKYGDGSSFNGYLSNDTIAIGDNKTQISVPSNFVLINSGNSSSVDIEGILGLGFKKLSNNISTLIDSLYNEGRIKKKIFALYLNYLGPIGNEEGYGDLPSSLSIGEYDIEKYADKNTLRTLNIDSRSGFWLRVFDEVHIGKVKIKEVTAIFDSGTTLIYLDYFTFAAFYNSISNQRNCRYRTLILCVCDHPNDVPGMKLQVPNHEFEIPPERLWYFEEGVCYFLGLPNDMGDFWILGDVFLQNYYTVYDMDKSTIMFASSLGNYLKSLSMIALICLGFI